MDVGGLRGAGGKALAGTHACRHPRYAEQQEVAAMSFAYILNFLDITPPKAAINALPQQNGLSLSHQPTVRQRNLIEI
jgi:hypothetical protein